MEQPRRVLLQVRHSPEGLINTCNQYLEMYSGSDYQKIVVYLKGKYDKKTEQKVNGDQVIFLELPDKALEGIPKNAAKALQQIIESYGVTDILAHRYKSTLISALASSDSDLKSRTAVFHGNGQLRTLSRKLVTRFYLRDKFRFVGVSSQVRKDLLNSHSGLEESSVFAIPLSIDIDAQDKLMLSRGAAREALNIALDAPVVGHIGRLSPSKDQETLLRAFLRTRQEVPEAILAIIGEGRQEAKLRGLADTLGISESVRFLGAKSEAAKYLKAFDVFTMTSCNEGFGRALLESMVAECPIVATDIPAFQEAMGPALELCGIGNDAAIGKKIAETLALTEEEKQGIGKRLKQRVQSTFSTEAIAEQYRQQILS